MIEEKEMECCQCGAIQKVKIEIKRVKSTNCGDCNVVHSYSVCDYCGKDDFITIPFVLGEK